MEMTGTNGTLDAARNGQRKQRQLLRKERLADGNQFSLLTAHANGRPLYPLHARVVALPIEQRSIGVLECWSAESPGVVSLQDSATPSLRFSPSPNRTLVVEPFYFGNRQGSLIDSQIAQTAVEIVVGTETDPERLMVRNV